MQTKYERMWGPELAGLKTLKMIKATMLKVTGDVSCTCKCMQALEALYFFARYMCGANFLHINPTKILVSN